MLAAARPTLVGCALLAAFLLGGCGSGGSDSTGAATVTSHAATTGEESSDSTWKNTGRPAKAGVGDPCQTQLGSFVASMDSLRRRLAVGLTYDQYVAEVRGVRSTYKKIPIDRIELTCVDTVGTPSEKAFNRYIEAADDWGECVSEAGCSSATVEPVLQRRWRIASHFLTAADEALNAAAP